MIKKSNKKATNWNSPPNNFFGESALQITTYFAKNTNDFIFLQG